MSYGANHIRVSKAKWSNNWTVRDFLVGKTYTFMGFGFAIREADRLARTGFIWPGGLVGVEFK